jgi:hypothetical protein
MKSLSTIQKRTTGPYATVAGLCEILVGVDDFSYSVAFIILVVAGGSSRY